MRTSESKLDSSPSTKIMKMIQDNKIRDGKTLVGILLLFGGKCAVSMIFRGSRSSLDDEFLQQFS